jgi:glutathione S-transferase
LPGADAGGRRSQAHRKLGHPEIPRRQDRLARLSEGFEAARQGQRGDGLINANFYRDWGYNLCYPQIFPHLKRRSDEAQAATLEFGKENAKRWLSLLDSYWLGPNKPYLCGNDITIADYFGSGIVTLGEAIGVDFTPYPNIARWLDRMKALPSWNSVNEVFYGLVGSLKGQKFVTLS